MDACSPLALLSPSWLNWWSVSAIIWKNTKITQPYSTVNHIFTVVIFPIHYVFYITRLLYYLLNDCFTLGENIRVLWTIFDHIGSSANWFWR